MFGIKKENKVNEKAKPVEEKKEEVKAIETQDSEELDSEEEKTEDNEQEQETMPLDNDDLLAALQNHEQRLMALESALFRLKGAL